VTRIIAGEFRGRRIAAPKDRRIRPTAARVREAWMSILGARLPGSRVVDLFAGTGALGLEALSRGACGVDFVESAPAARALLRRNITGLGAGPRTRILRDDAHRFVEGLAPLAYDVALADPPYAGDHAERLVARFRAVPFARVLAVEHAAAAPVPGDDTRRYGDTAITFCFAP
jgi:16S rRNA (guanine966-N2)-methyltransferase